MSQTTPSIVPAQLDTSLAGEAEPAVEGLALPVLPPLHATPIKAVTGKKVSYPVLMRSKMYYCKAELTFRVCCLKP